MSALTKTSDLVRMDLPISKLENNPLNPNAMKAREFDLLVDNINRMGITDPVLVCKTGEEGKYRIVGGHHRCEAARFLGFDEIPCTIITDPDFDQEEEEFQLVRHNVIHGSMDPDKFFELYSKYAGKYGDEILQDSFGFADSADWKRLVDQVAKQLPDAATQKKFKEAAKEIKTIDGLSALLNKMFTAYGNTLPHGYMVFDYGGRKSFWLQASAKTIGHIEAIGHLCLEQGVMLDDVIMQLFARVQKEPHDALLKEAFDSSPKMETPENMIGMPLKDKLIPSTEGVTHGLDKEV